MSDPKGHAVAQAGKGRTWMVYVNDFETDAEFRAAVEQELVDIFPMAFRGGRGVIAAPLRMKNADGVYETIGFAFEEVFMPAVRERAEPATEVETPADPEPES